MKLVERDLSILGTVAALRLARSWHLHELHFEGRTLKVCQVRLQKLWANGYLERLFQPMVLVGGRAEPRSTTPIYQLSYKGVTALREAGRKVVRRSNAPSPYRLTHDLLVLDAKVALTVASTRFLAGPPRFWWDESATRKYLRRHSAHEPPVVPDAAFSLHAQQGNLPAAYLLEVDTGSEPLTRTGTGSSLGGKLQGYAMLHKRDVLASALGCKAVRVVFITSSVTRADHLLTLIGTLPVPSGLFLVTTTEATIPGVASGPTLRPFKVLERVLRCARCPLWHSFIDTPQGAA